MGGVLGPRLAFAFDHSRRPMRPHERACARRPPQSWTGSAGPRAAHTPHERWGEWQGPGGWAVGSSAPSATRPTFGQVGFRLVSAKLSPGRHLAGREKLARESLGSGRGRQSTHLQYDLNLQRRDSHVVNSACCSQSGSEKSREGRREGGHHNSEVQHIYDVHRIHKCGVFLIFLVTANKAIWHRT